jgi:hypothetical protein
VRSTNLELGNLALGGEVRCVGVWQVGEVRVNCNDV